MTQIWQIMNKLFQSIKEWLCIHLHLKDYCRPKIHILPWERLWYRRPGWMWKHAPHTHFRTYHLPFVGRGFLTEKGYSKICLTTIYIHKSHGTSVLTEYVLMKNIILTIKPTWQKSTGNFLLDSIYCSVVLLSFHFCFRAGCQTQSLPHAKQPPALRPTP